MTDERIKELAKHHLEEWLRARHIHPWTCEEATPFVAAAIRAAVDEATAELRERLDAANGCLIMVMNALKAFGCECGPDSHEATPPMMYPEWIACVLRSHTKKSEAALAAAETSIAILNESLKVVYADRDAALALLRELVAGHDADERGKGGARYYAAIAAARAEIEERKRELAGAAQQVRTIGMDRDDYLRRMNEAKANWQKEITDRVWWHAKANELEADLTAARAEIERLREVADQCMRLVKDSGMDASTIKGWLESDAGVKLAEVRALRAERDEALAVLRSWREVDRGCGGPVCNIGGGLCSDCGVKLAEVEDAAAALLAKHDRYADWTETLKPDEGDMPPSGTEGKP